jgi:hypothetical protein
MNIIETEKMRKLLMGGRAVHFIMLDKPIYLERLVCVLVVKNDGKPQDKKIDPEKSQLIARRLRLAETEDTTTFTTSGYELIPVVRGGSKVYTLDEKFKAKLISDDDLVCQVPEKAVEAFNDLKIKNMSAKAYFVINTLPAQNLQCRQLLNTYDNFMHTRIIIGNQLVNQFKNKLGLEAYSKLRDKYILSIDDELDDKQKAKLSDQLRKSFHEVTEGVVEIMKSVKAKFPDPEHVTQHYFEKWVETHPEETGLISTWGEYQQLDMYESLKKDEENAKKALESIIKTHPLWVNYFKNVKGIGPIAAGRIIGNFNINVAVHCSSFIKYAGLDCVDGRARKMSDTIEETYIDQKGKVQIKKSLGYNPAVKAALLGVIGPSFLKVNNLKYRKIYDDMRERYSQRPDIQEKVAAKKCSVHMMALRYMVKQFVKDLWIKWRTLEGLPLNGGPYEEGVLGLHHHYDDEGNLVTE